MSLPGSQATGSKPSKVPIPRFNPPGAKGRDRVDKGRSMRACLNCRNLKVKCTGENQCQRCMSLGRFCEYSPNRKDRLKTVTGRYEHAIDLLRSVVNGDEDRQKILDAIRIFDEEDAPRSTRTRIQTPGLPDAGNNRREANDDATIGATSVVREPSYLPLMWSLPYDGKSFHQAETNTSSAETSRPSTAIFQPESSSRQTDPVFLERGLHHFPADSSCLEVFWYLQTQSLEEAQNYLEYIRSRGPLSLTSNQKWLRDQQKSSARSNSLSDTSVDKPPSAKRAKVIDDGLKEKMRATKIATDSTIYGTSEAQRCSPYVTITTVRNAVSMFFNATGLLFHVFTKDQADYIQHELLNEFRFPSDTPFTTIIGNIISLKDKADLAELCGMAAVGLLYLRLGDKDQAPPVGLSDYFYSTARQMLDSAIEADPLRAMKMCALLAMYNIVVKGSVALAYVELGLALARNYAIVDPGSQSTERANFMDHKRTWRTLLTFSGWLAASIGYASEQSTPSRYLLEDIQDAEEEDIVQRELVKVTVIKSSIIRKIPEDGVMSDDIIDDFRKELDVINKRLPRWMSLAALINPQKTTPLRRVIMYFHLFFLSAMQLLHRRAMANIAYSKSPLRAVATSTAAREGLMAAKLAARILVIMRQEDSIVRLCWLCIYSSYTASIIILHAAVQKMLNRHPDSAWIADLTLVNVCVDTLKFCAEIDPVAAKLTATVSVYVEELQRFKGFKLNADLGENTDEGHLVDYLFTTPQGDTTLDRAARDLERLIRYPFGTTLELIPQGSPKAPTLHKTLINWQEAVVGIPQEWDWELQNCSLRPDDKGAGNGAGACQIGDIMSRITPGYFVSMGDAPPWSTWTSRASF
ncbi:hypothetical protein K505DRAFT_320727 [Melanomma pulvis-pyrius CBS 109.77]|uniref:Zn(2)-C6 fungal-type domain-containing protein n=1 Tax=Melanomma pulvis-pyrius CBS 109.77 TaxID=1314802 RepID=A0A6A6XUF0_9PLEO|nr:hypothetical protein K505DRAFT_320727 [Melanomma pulvis-pyrius CBS 109.77]